MGETVIIGIKVKDHTADATVLQDILTRYGCVIRTRLGLPSNDAAGTADKGIIILELTGDTEEIQHLEKALDGLNYLEIKKMVF